MTDVTIIDVGIDLDVPEIKEAGVVLKNINTDDQTHGTAVTGVYIRTLQHLLATYYQKNIDLKNFVHINIQSATCTQDLMHVLKGKSFPSNPGSINMSLTCHHPDYTFGSEGVFEQIHTALKKRSQEGSMIFTAAANGGIYTTSDIAPQNDPYICAIGAYYTKDYDIPADTVRLYIAGLSTPGPAVWFCANGAQLTYNTVSCPAFYKDDVFFIFNWSGKTTMSSPSPRKKMIHNSGTSFATPEMTGFWDFTRIVRPDLDNHNRMRLFIESTDKFETSSLRNEWWDSKTKHYVRTFYQNHAVGRNGTGRFFSPEFGYGRINQTKLLHLLQTWENKEIKEKEFSMAPAQEIIDQGQYLYIYDCPQNDDVFNVHLTFKSSQLVKNLTTLSLTSPAGTESFIYHPYFSPNYINEKIGDNWFFALLSQSYLTKSYLEREINNRATNVNFYGEPSTGRWILRTNVKLTEAKLTFRTIRQIDDVYWYDNDILAVEKPNTLSDCDGGWNTIDLSAYTLGEVEINLQPGEKRGITFMAPNNRTKFVPIGEGTFNVVFGPLGGKRLG